MRNLEKDEIEMAAKRERMLAVGFRIFSENTIEVATMKEIAKACGLGYKTMFRYFGTKTAFVIAIGAEKWKAERDGTLKLGLPETEFFYTILYIMLSAAGKFAEGLVYPPEHAKDMTGELKLLKDMIMRTYLT